MFVPVTVLRQMLGITPIELVALVVGNAKGRFEFEVRPNSGARPARVGDPPVRCGAAWVRAVQGHSGPVQNPEALSFVLSEEDHDDLLPLIHGSKTFLMQSIRANGLVPGGITHNAGRAAVHFKCTAA